MLQGAAFELVPEHVAGCNRHLLVLLPALLPKQVRWPLVQAWTWHCRVCSTTNVRYAVAIPHCCLVALPTSHEW
jgi:hypothetical protein